MLSSREVKDSDYARPIPKNNRENQKLPSCADKLPHVASAGWLLSSGLYDQVQRSTHDVAKHGLPRHAILLDRL